MKSSLILLVGLWLSPAQSDLCVGSKVENLDQLMDVTDCAYLPALSLFITDDIVGMLSRGSSVNL